MTRNNLVCSEPRNGVQMSENDNWDDVPNPYAAPASLPQQMTADPDEDFETQELRAVIGSKADYYLRKWTTLLEGRGGNGGFNWAAFFFCGIWFSYRKMYKFTCIFFGIIIMASIAEELLFVGVLGLETPTGLDDVISLVVAIVCGRSGNRWYLSHVRKVIADVRAEGLGDDAQLELLSQRGGTSLATSFGFFVLFCAVMFVVLIAIEFVLFQGAAP